MLFDEFEVYSASARTIHSWLPFQVVANTIDTVDRLKNSGDLHITDVLRNSPSKGDLLLGLLGSVV